MQRVNMRLTRPGLRRLRLDELRRRRGQRRVSRRPARSRTSSRCSGIAPSTRPWPTAPSKSGTSTRTRSPATVIRGYYSWNRGGSAVRQARRIAKNSWYGMLVPDNMIRRSRATASTGARPPRQTPTSHHRHLAHRQCENNGRSSPQVPRLRPAAAGADLLSADRSAEVAIRGHPVPDLFDAYSKMPNAASASSTPVALEVRQLLEHALRRAGRLPVRALRRAGIRRKPRHLLAFARQQLAQRAVLVRVDRGLMQGPGGLAGAVSGRGLATCAAGSRCSPTGRGSTRSGSFPTTRTTRTPLPNGANIPAVATFNCGADNEVVTVNFPAIAGATLVRVTFTNLQDCGIGPYVYRAGVRELNAYATVTKSGGFTVNGNYGDYSDIIKLVLAWAGFHWPKDEPFVWTSLGFAFEIVASIPNDEFLKEGRIWGDIELTGTYGVTPLPFTDFDKQPLMQAVTEIQDIIQFIFYGRRDRRRDLARAQHLGAGQPHQRPSPEAVPHGPGHPDPHRHHQHPDRAQLARAHLRLRPDRQNRRWRKRLLPEPDRDAPGGRVVGHALCQRRRGPAPRSSSPSGR